MSELAILGLAVLALIVVLAIRFGIRLARANRRVGRDVEFLRAIPPDIDWTGKDGP